MSPDVLKRLHDAWDKLDTASRRVQITTASNLSDACEVLEEARREMSTAIRETYA